MEEDLWTSWTRDQADGGAIYGSSVCPTLLPAMFPKIALPTLPKAALDALSPRPYQAFSQSFAWYLR